LLVDAQGERLTPSHAVNKGRRYRYYISAALSTATGNDRGQFWRLAAREIEDCVISILIDALTNPAGLLEGPTMPGMSGDQMRKLLGRAARLAAALRRASGERAKIVRELVERSSSMRSRSSSNYGTACCCAERSRHAHRTRQVPAQSN